MQKTLQVSESLELGMILALSGGFMDAYSYLCHDKVFANAQTGNIILMGLKLAEGNFLGAVRYLSPVAAFAVGIALADIIRHHMKDRDLFHWRQLSVLCEAILLGIVGFIPQKYNLPANSLTSLACGIQVESFRKIQGNGIATTMCIGNLRSGTSALTEYWYSRDKKAAKRGLMFYQIILSFAVGAVLGSFFVARIREHAVWICIIFLGAAFCLMFIDREKEKEKENL